MSCRLPGGIESPWQFWEAIIAGECKVSQVPYARWDSDFVQNENSNQEEIQRRMRWGGFIRDLDLFDPEFFNISIAEARLMDPQQKLLLESAYIAFRDAGYTKEQLKGLNAGVFIGIETNDATQNLLRSMKSDTLDVFSLTGQSHATATGRISFIFGLQGPSVAMNSACSSTMSAFHSAIRSLQSGDCDVAIVLGVNIIICPIGVVSCAAAGLTSPTGMCHTFDDSADGYVRSEGVGAIVLKRIENAKSDNDAIYAEILGTGLAQDGMRASLTAPNGKSQELLLRKALKDAGIFGNNVDYIEAHGTGTKLGDPIELSAISAVMRSPEDSNPLVIGSAKANLGHMEAASSIGGIIKCILTLMHETVTPNIGLRKLNSHIEEKIAKLPILFPKTVESLRAISGKIINNPLSPESVHLDQEELWDTLFFHNHKRNLQNFYLMKQFLQFLRKESHFHGSVELMHSFKTILHLIQSQVIESNSSIHYLIHLVTIHFLIALSFLLFHLSRLLLLLLGKGFILYQFQVTQS
jgi:acyl transferase domain-containing protein